MDHARNNCERAWKDALSYCREILGEDDYEMIVGFESPEKVVDALRDLENKYAKSPILRLLKGIKPQLARLQTFATVIFLGLGANNISAACLWGGTSLLIELASQSEQALREISNVINELGQRLTLFEIYSESIELDPQLLENFFDLLVDLVLNTVTAIKHFRKNDIQTAVVIATWKTVHSKFGDMLKNIASKIDHLQKLIEAQNITQLNRTQARLAQSLSQLNMNIAMGGQHQEINTPCSTLPFQRNPAFYGRKEYLQELSGHLNPKDRAEHPSIRSVALWGTGGIGKSQIALEYANQQWLAGTSVILWIASETEAEISKAFNDAAGKLNLPGYLPTNTPDQNRYIVLQWLQKTDVFWLLIFDNVEDRDVLRQNWPTIGNGSILVTCRSEILAASPAAAAIEVLTFTPKQSGELIFSILNKKEVNEDEVLAARKLSEKLGGLALAIDIIAKQIRSRKQFKTIRDFLPYYDEHCRAFHKRPKRGIMDPYYSKDVETVWQTAFEDLSADAAKLMSLFCFMAPEGIPQWVIEPETAVMGGWDFLSDSEEFEEAKMELLDLSLIRMNEESGLISIHRLTQAAYFDRMSKQDRAGAFSCAFRLLRLAFPGRKGHHHLYRRWQLCEQSRQHVLALQAQYNILRKDGFSEQGDDFSSLICDLAWYLLEIQAFVTCEHTLASAEENCTDKTSLLYAYICTNFVSLFERSGRSPRAYEKAKLTLKIRKAKTQDENDLANGFSDVGYTSIAMYNGKEGLENLDKAIAIAEQTPEPERYKIYNMDRFLRNRGRGNMILRLYDAALEDFKRAEYYQTKIHGEKSHYEGECMHERGKIAAAQNDLDTAYALFQKAYDLVSPGKPTHSSVMATRYQQGRVCMAREQYDEALHHFRDALTICQLNEVQRGNQGESARVKWRMSQIMELQGLGDEANAYREAAGRIKKELADTGDYPNGITEDDSWDAFLGLLYR